MLFVTNQILIIITIEIYVLVTHCELVLTTLPRIRQGLAGRKNALSLPALEPEGIPGRSPVHFGLHNAGGTMEGNLM